MIDYFMLEYSTREKFKVQNVKFIVYDHESSDYSSAIPLTAEWGIWNPLRCIPNLGPTLIRPTLYYYLYLSLKSNSRNTICIN